MLGVPIIIRHVFSAISYDFIDCFIIIGNLTGYVVVVTGNLVALV